VGAHVPPFFAPYHGDITHMTPTPACVRRPKGPAACARGLSGNPGALIIRARHMGHKIFACVVLTCCPSTGDGQDKAPAACSIGRVTGFAPRPVGLGTIGGLTTYDDQLGPTRRNQLALHLAQQRIFAAIIRMALGPNEANAHRAALAVSHRHHRHEATVSISPHVQGV
jgi:hypothetical protein